MSPSSTVQAFFDPLTGTVSYVLWDHATRQAAVIDPVLDYEPRSGHTSTQSLDEVLAYLAQHRLQVAWILETHVHADHLSGAHHLRARTGGRVAIGGHIRQVQATFRTTFGLEAAMPADGSQFDHLFEDGETFRIGSLEARAMLVPGHTPADMAYQVDGAVFVGDTLFMPDVGTARADFPGGDAQQLYRSIQKLLALPPDTKLYVCHDYPPAGREPAWMTTVADQRAHNIHIHEGIREEVFAARRRARDATLDVPTLILPSLQVNMQAGQLPPPDAHGVACLRIPLNVFPVPRAA